MKKAISLLFALFVLLPAAAFAAEPFETQSFSGNGLAVLETAALPRGLYRISLSEGENVTVSSYQASANPPMQTIATLTWPLAAAFVQGPVTAESFIVETEGAWALSISALAEGGSIGAEGAGCFIGDLFTVSAPKAISVKAGYFDPSLTSGYTARSSFSVTLHTVDLDGSVTEKELFVGMMSTGAEPFTFDYLLLPNDTVSGYFWDIQCEPHMSWSVLVK